MNVANKFLNSNWIESFSKETGKFGSVDDYVGCNHSVTTVENVKAGGHLVQNQDEQPEHTV